MKCADCGNDFAGSYLKPFVYSERIAGVATLHTLQLCKGCRTLRNDAKKPMPNLGIAL